MKNIKYLFHIKKDIAGQEGYTVLSITQKGIMPKDLSKNEGQLAESYRDVYKRQGKNWFGLYGFGADGGSRTHATLLSN